MVFLLIEKIGHFLTNFSYYKANYINKLSGILPLYLIFFPKIGLQSIRVEDKFWQRR